MAAFLTGRFTRGDDADGFFMADHMYYIEKSFAFGITDGGLADSVGLLVSTIVTKGSKNTSQAAWKDTPCF